MTAVNPCENSPIQITHNIQVRTRPISSRLAVKTEAHKIWRQRNSQHELSINTNGITINLSPCMVVQDIQIQHKMTYTCKTSKHTFIDGWPSSRGNGKQDISAYWTLRDEIAMVDWEAIKDKWIMVPTQMQPKSIWTTTQNNVFIEKTRLLAEGCLYWLNDAVNNWSTCFKFQQIQPKNKIIPNEILGKPWEILGANLFTLRKQPGLWEVQVQALSDPPTFSPKSISCLERNNYLFN